MGTPPYFIGVIGEESIVASTEIQAHATNLVVPTAFIERPPFPVKIKEHSKATTMVHKSNNKASKPYEQIEV